jgi:HTH-type transcriptional regulator/antitoxin PezA
MLIFPIRRCTFVDYQHFCIELVSGVCYDNLEKGRRLLMNEQIKLLRKHLGLTQQEFADRLKISRGNIGSYEVGKSAPSDAVISLICEKFNVNEEWLRTGNGPMEIELARSEKITDFAADLLKDEEDSYRRRLIEELADLDEEEWELLEKISEKAARKKKDQAPRA